MCGKGSASVCKEQGSWQVGAGVVRASPALAVLAAGRKGGGPGNKHDLFLNVLPRCWGHQRTILGASGEISRTSEAGAIDFRKCCQKVQDKP